MKSLKRILTATDLSVPAHYAVARAFDLAAAVNAELTVMHVVNRGALDGLRRMAGIEPATVEQGILEDARGRLSQLVAELESATGVRGNTRLATGTVLPVLLSATDEMDADLLVVGARGEDLLGRLLLGTTAERLLRHLQRAVLTVRRAPQAAYRRVLVAVDFSKSSLPAIHAARVVAPGAELVLLHAFVAPFESRLRMAGVRDEVIDHYLQAARRESMEKLRDLVAEAGLLPGDVRFSAAHGDAAYVILEHAREENCELIVMGKHGQTLIEKLLLGSVTKHVLAESDGDVLVICD